MEWRYVGIRLIGESRTYLSCSETEEEAWDACAKDDCHPDHHPLYIVVRQKDSGLEPSERKRG